MKPLAIDLYCGKGGWARGLLAAGYRVLGLDTADMGGYPGQLVLQDVLTLCGSQLRNATLIVASPPCQNYSYLAMPWSRSKSDGSQAAKALRRRWESEGPDNRLFDACFRIQREASEAAGHQIPMVVENVKGAQPWVGRAAWHYGSFYLWGDVPALMPIPSRLRKVNRHLAVEVPIGTGKSSWFFGNTKHELRDGIKSGGGWWHDPGSMTRFSSRSAARKEASARIAMIPFDLAYHIGRVYLPAGK